ncbi:MAG: AMP-binding protein [Ilumatobacteraceae bacterium]
MSAQPLPTERQPLARRPLSSSSPANWICAGCAVLIGRASWKANGRIYTFGEIDRQVNRLARALDAAGLRRFDRIGILATDSVDYMVLLMASLKLGTTYVPLNYRLADAEIELLARTADLDAFFTIDRYRWTRAPRNTPCALACG